MKKYLATVTLFLCALTANANQATPKPLTPESNALIKELAERPFAAVVNGKCEVRGAVWAGGPRAGVNVELLGLDGSTHRAKTSEVGVFSLSIPYSAPMVYQERIADPVRVREELKDRVQVISPAVVCDHRANQALPSSLTTKKE